jgi:hypothetical protein
MLIVRQTINHYITYSIITAKPELSYSSVLSTVRCFSVTSGEHEGSTFVEWTGNFSSDADAGELATLVDEETSQAVYTTLSSADTTTTGVIQDAKFKRREALADLSKVATKK